MTGAWRGRGRSSPADSRAPRAFVLAALLAFAPAVCTQGVQEASAALPAPAGPEAVVETELGTFVIRLLPDLAPGHVRHFVKAAKAGGYDGTIFHRIIPRGIIQGGDPLTKDPKKAALYGTGGLGLLKAELSDRPMKRGVVAAVLRPGRKDSGGSQFFICLSDQPALTGQYTVFGEVVEGMNVVDRIGETPVEGDRAKVRVEIRKVAIRAPVRESPGPGGEASARGDRPAPRG